MGLAARKVKQRIQADPRNLTWSDDSSKFGAKYLQSLGWTPGSGLGAAGEGRASHVKVHQKLDALGIGANRKGDADWKLSRKFDGLLARLNQVHNADLPSVITEEEETKDTIVDPPSQNDEVQRSGTDTANATETNIKKKKRKKDIAEDGERDTKATKRRKKEENKRKEKKRAGEEAEKLAPGDTKIVDEAAGDKIIDEKMEIPTKVAPRYRAHRARHLAAKRLAVASATSMNEILGIASSSLQDMSQDGRSMTANVSPSKPHLSDGRPGIQTRAESRPYDGESSTIDQSTCTPGASAGIGMTATLPKDQQNDLIKKSGQSMAEYFAERLRSKTRDKPKNT